jgi:RNA-directed DNA polymerase
LLGYPATDDSLGDTALFQVCERLSKFGPPNANKVIAIFDRDNQQILDKLKPRGDLDGFQVWGNNVYSFAIPTPAHRRAYKHISIEMLYTDADVAITTDDGKRLYFDNETKKEILPGNVITFVAIPAVEAHELTKKPFGDEAEKIVDGNGRPVGLSKAIFADLIYREIGQFANVDRTAFSAVFAVIKDILADG